MYIPISLLGFLSIIISQEGASDATANPAKVGRSGQRSTILVHSCSSTVYCQGDLLDTVQRHKLYTDSKTFVDMSQKNSPEMTLANFEAFMAATNRTPSKSEVQQFVDDNFEFVNETEAWTPSDYKQNPVFLDRISDAQVKKFASTLVSLWPLLGRRVKDAVKTDPAKHSLIPVPQGFVVPGGRFREIYYWDSYWIIKGLLISEMTTTVKGMLENFIYLIKTYGLIPNGSRVYYVNRSQPPLFTSMVGLYVEATNDVAWLRSNIDYIETELKFWLTNRTLSLVKNNVTYELAHYGTVSNTPRPESYSEDLATCAYCTTDEERNACYNALKTAAETGWDFSTRWIFDENGQTSANLSFTDSQRVVPVDLNALLCKSFRLLTDFYTKTGNASKRAEWAARADQWQETIDLFLYNDTDGVWYDYDYELDKQRAYFFPSNLAPLWADCHGGRRDKQQLGKNAFDYLKRQGIDMFEGGVPASLEDSGEQWDMPNAWPPLQEYVVLGLYKTGHAQAQELARTLGNRWVAANMIGYEANGAMYEKYDALTPGKYGAGGEYEVQLGFGWTNGVALSFIEQFNSESSGQRTIRALSGAVYCYIVFFGLLLL